MGDFASNSKNTVVDENDFTQSGFASNTDNFASNSKNPVTDANDFTQSTFTALSKWGTTVKPPPVTWVVHNMLQADAANYVAGEPGVGKSWISSDLAVSVATNTPFLGRQTQQGSVLVINFDDTETLPRQYAERTARARGYELADLPLYYWEPRPDEAKPLHGVMDSAVFDELAFQIDALKPKLIIVDSFSSAFPSLDGNKGPDIVRMHEVLRQLRIKSPGACMVLIDHTPKEVVMQSKRRGVSGSQQKNGQVRAGHIVSRVEPSEVGGEDVLRWDFFKINGAPPQKSFAIDREQTATTAKLTVRDLPERDRAPKSTQAYEAALTFIQTAGEDGIARTALIEKVATIANVARRTIEQVLNDEVHDHPQVIERSLGGRGNPKGYKWRSMGEDDGNAGGDPDDLTQNDVALNQNPSQTQKDDFTQPDSTQPADLTQNPIALNQTREGRENAISRNDATALRENPVASNKNPFWPTVAEHPYNPGASRLEYLDIAIQLAGRKGRRFTDPLAARAEAHSDYVAVCSTGDCADLCLKPNTATPDELRTEALMLYGGARERATTLNPDLFAWAEAAEELLAKRRQAN